MSSHMLFTLTRRSNLVSEPAPETASKLLTHFRYPKVIKRIYYTMCNKRPLPLRLEANYKICDTDPTTMVVTAGRVLNYRKRELYFTRKISML